MHARMHTFTTPITRDNDYDCYVRFLNGKQLHEETVLSRSLYRCLNKDKSVIILIFSGTPRTSVKPGGIVMHKGLVGATEFTYPCLVVSSLDL